jgi:hypothetical protein
MALINPMPDLDVLTQVLQLTDAVDAERALGPPSPVVVDPSKARLKPKTAKQAELRLYLAALSDDHQAQIHALFWLGRETPVRAENYENLYEYALTTDLGTAGAGYLTGKAALGDDLRRGLQKLGLGLGLDRARPDGTQNSTLVLEERTHA